MIPPIFRSPLRRAVRLRGALFFIGCQNPDRPNPSPTDASDARARAVKTTTSNILVADQFNNRVIEVNGAGDIVWQFRLGPHDVSATSILGVNDAQRVGGLTL